METSSLLQWIELSASAFHHNIRSLAKLAHGKMIAVSVKANAYGHGLSEMVRLLMDEVAVGYITVHSLDEALAARRTGWARKIMVLGPIAADRLNAVIEHNLEPVVFDRSTLEALGKLAEKNEVRIRTHLKLETGTHRQGITSKELPALAKVYHRHAYLRKPYGAGMHFANIEDTTSHEYAEYQLRTFNESLAEMGRLNIKPAVRHTACSAAVILFEQTHFEMVRPGISAYGHWPSKETYLSYRLAGGADRLFRPVLTWRAKITQIKKLAADSFVGYGCTYRTTSPTKLAVIPVGYSDGYDRGLSNTAYVLVRGRRAPVRGRICMNLCMIDVTDVQSVRLGDQATLIGSSGQENLTAEQLAGWAATINYEILARLSPNIPRVITP